MARSLNKVTLIGNLTRDPELRYTPQGTAVCTFGIATNRQWSTDSGEKKEDVEFHRIVAWQKLAELCAQLLGKGRKVYVEGRLQTRKWTGQDNVERTTTEIVISDMIILDSRGAGGGESASNDDVPDDVFDDFTEDESDLGKASKKKTAKSKPAKKGKTKAKKEEEDDDIPF
jgi:single-strand DNA-binding protein